LVAVGCAALLAGFGAAPARAAGGVPAAAAGSCPDPQYVLQAYNASHVWNKANTRGAGQTIGVVGAPDRVAEAVCAAKALAPDATVVPGSAAGPIVVVADGSVDPPSSGAGTLVIAGAGDTSGPMPARPPGIVNVAAADISSNGAQAASSYGPAVLLAAYGNDTSTAAGYVGALAAILHSQNPAWTARQVAAQMAGSIGYLSNYSNADDHLGFGIIVPDQAVSVAQIDPSTLPARFATAFPANPPPGNTAPSTRSVPSTAPSSSAPSGPSSAASGSASAPTATGPSGSAFPSVSGGPTDIGSANLFPTNQAFSTGPSNGSNAAAGGSGGSGGFSPVLVIGFVVILAGGGYVLWQRRRQPKPADVKPESEWEAPSGPRHSGYSPPEE
jgi:hypothetical protein